MVVSWQQKKNHLFNRGKKVKWVKRRTWTTCSKQEEALELSLNKKLLRCRGGEEQMGRAKASVSLKTEAENKAETKGHRSLQIGEGPLQTWNID